MAENPLLLSLDAYAQQLEAHLAKLRERHEELAAAWARLRDVYEGEGAQVFGEAFASASARLDAYATQGALIEQQLRGKIAELGAFDAADPEL